MSRMLALAGAVLLLPATALAAPPTHDIRGTWAFASYGGQYNATIVFDTLDCATGKVTGRGAGGAYTWPVKGTIDGVGVVLDDGPYDQLPDYTSHSTGRFTDASHITGTFDDTYGHDDGPFEMLRQSGPPQDGGACVDGRASATAVQCDKENPGTPGEQFRCTATVGDASGKQPPATPGGTVTFASTGGGVFPYGERCALAASSSGPTAFCAVTWIPGAMGVPTGVQPPLTASYAGDAAFLPSSGRPENRFAPPPVTPAPVSPPKVGDPPVPDPCGASARIATLRQARSCPRKRDPKDATIRVYEIQGRAFVTRDGVTSQIQPGEALYIGDVVTTDRDSVAAMELLIGGRVGVPKGQSLMVWNEGELRTPDGTPRALKSGGLWQKFNAPTKPLTVQTRGGAMSIKG